ncbi:efflux RND transporter periplasmic adaptor subunit [Veronia pacifica]|uniref:Efflux transporter periplasmic adaptor subunit n=1 Tax=Veronia pacifica TaxID=1080227 RepID=A0A1C3EGR0_9GAMM|nr:efflux RND transporter periplasmic adaptor subunit [Veronia pacifica]ODA32442.1 efflux transporter periplasmic adaptor subunit [Veronia pacifica]
MPKEGPSFFTHIFSRRPWIISVATLALLVAWVANGQQSPTSPDAQKQSDVPLARVSYDTFISKPIVRSISLYGKTMPNRQLSLRTEVSAKVIAVNVKKGMRVSKGDLIVTLDKTDRPIQLQRAQSLLNVRQKEFNAAKSLKKKGLQGEVSFSRAQANLTDAKATVENLRLALARTEIRAPFDGVVDKIDVELGDYARSGDPVASLVDLDPLLIKANVSERHIEQVKTGTQTKVRLLNDEIRDATLRYQSSVSSAQTNTFDVEFELSNPDFALPAGMSTEVELPLEESMAVKVTPAMLALDGKGNLGVKTLVGDRVKFVPINLVKSESDGVWLAGLGQKVDLITKGQGFVRDGDQVIAVHSPIQP